MPKNNTPKFSYKYLILPDEKLILEYYSGELKLSNILNIKTNICEDELYDPTYAIIENFREARLLFNRDDVQAYINFIKYHKLMYGERKTAFLTITPKETALATLLDVYKGDLPIEPIAFSTKNSIFKFLSIKDDKINYIRELLDSLKN